MQLDRPIFLDCLKRIMKPVVRFCIRRSLSIQDFMSVAKILFVETAVEELGKTTTKLNVSRISLATGIQRFEVKKLYRQPSAPPPPGSNVLTKVIGQWEKDSEFTTPSGRPRALTASGDKSEFRRLVERVNRNYNHATVLFELKRIGAVRESARGLTLTSPTARFYKSPAQTFDLLGRDIDSLLRAGEQNVFDRREIPSLHLTTEYDNIFRRNISQIRAWLVDEGKAFHKKLRDYLSQFDKDVNPDGEDHEAGATVRVGTFSFTVEQPPGKT